MLYLKNASVLLVYFFLMYFPNMFAPVNSGRMLNRNVICRLFSRLLSQHTAPLVCPCTLCDCSCVQAE